uniref:Deoxynucleoside kinase n=1 Tax=candidate division WOR-3 bacterium TaxID=2052148 RepID=A0A7V4E3B3_UNCW3
MEKIEYIAIEGVMGVGKTSLATKLANYWRATLILEKTENPFLPLFYENPRSYAFQTQLFFLLTRYQQQIKLNQLSLFESKKIVSDYLFEKDKIYASVNLSESEYYLYEQIFQLLEKNLNLKPTKIIFLQTNLEILWERLKKSEQKYERNIEWEYLVAINNSYNQFFFHYQRAPVLIVNTENYNYLENRKAFKNLVMAVENLKEGRKFLV